MSTNSKKTTKTIKPIKSIKSTLSLELIHKKFGKIADTENMSQKLRAAAMLIAQQEKEERRMLQERIKVAISSMEIATPAIQQLKEMQSVFQNINKMTEPLISSIEIAVSAIRSSTGLSRTVQDMNKITIPSMEITTSTIPSYNNRIENRHLYHPISDFINDSIPKPPIRFERVKLLSESFEKSVGWIIALIALVVSILSLILSL